MKITLENGREFSLSPVRVAVGGYRPSRVEIEAGDFACLSRCAVADLSTFVAIMAQLEDRLSRVENLRVSECQDRILDARMSRGETDPNGELGYTPGLRR